LEAASVNVKLNDEETKFENCVQLDIDEATTTMTLTSSMCRTMNKFFICQIAIGMCLSFQSKISCIVTNLQTMLTSISVSPNVTYFFLSFFS